MSLEMCRWFALCDRAATRAQDHPVLGSVPICERCLHLYNEIGL
jgi:hypothetical protein